MRFPLLVLWLFVVFGGGAEAAAGCARMGKLANLVEYGRFDSSKLITHKFDKFEDIEEAMIMMRDKPRDMIKPAVILDD